MTVIMTVVAAVLGCSTLMGWLLFRNAKRRLADAEAAKAEAEAELAKWDRYEKQLDHSLTTITLLQQQLAEDAKQNAKLNSAIDDASGRIHQLTDRALAAEAEVNRVNMALSDEKERHRRAAEDRDRERLLKELYKQWKCRVAECVPRDPPNESLRGKDLDKQLTELTNSFKAKKKQI